MKRLRLLWYLYPAFLVLTLAAVLAVTLYVTNTLHDFHITQIEKSLTARGRPWFPTRSAESFTRRTPGSWMP